MIRVGIIGFGYWGPNIVRNFNGVPGSTVAAICDKSTQRLKVAAQEYPRVRLTQDADEVITDPEVDLVAVITPVFSHYQLGKKVLLNGKHLFMEKLFTRTSAEAEELIDLAEKAGLRTIVDHTFLFHSSVRAIKRFVEEEYFGKLFYIDSTRINLGLFQEDVNVVWDLGPHDFSIVDYVLSQRPECLCAHGVDHFGNNLEDVGFVSMFFPNRLIAHFSFNWLSPVKVRRTLIGGEKKMCVWDDLLGDEKIKFYDKGVSATAKVGDYSMLVEYHEGDIYCPFLKHAEPLREQVTYLVDAISGNKPIVNDGYAGLRIVKLLEACDESIKNSGRMVRL